MGVAIEPVYRPGAAIGITLAPSPLLLLLYRLWLMGLISASLFVLPLFAPLILLMDCLEVGAVVLAVAERVAERETHVAQVPPRCLHSDATSRDTS